MKGDGNAGDGDIAVAVDIDVNLVPVHIQPLADRVDDPDVGLVGDEDVDLVLGQMGRLSEGGLGRLPHPLDGVFEDLIALHVDGVEVFGHGLDRGRAARSAGREVEEAGQRPVRFPGTRQNSGLVAAFLEDGGPGGVSEEDAGRAVLPVGDLGQHLRADEEDAAGVAAEDHAFGHDQSVNQPVQAATRSKAGMWPAPRPAWT